MNKAYISEDLLIYDHKKLDIYYSENLDMYITENFIIRAGYCDISTDVEIKKMEDCFVFSECYIEKLFEYGIDLSEYWDITNIDNSKCGFIIMGNEDISIVIDDIYFRNIIVPFNSDMSIPFKSNKVPVKIGDGDFIYAILMENLFEIFKPTKIDYENDDISKIQKIPKNFKDNFIFDDVSSFFDDMTSVFKIGEYRGQIDVNGNIIKKIKCDDFWPFIYSGGYSVIELNGKEGLLDQNNKFVIPLKYDEIHYFQNNIWKVKLDDKVGLVDINDNIIIPLNYDDFDNYNDKYIIASRENSCGIIDINENIIVPFEYDKLDICYKKENYFYATKSFKEGIIDINNKTIIPFDYERICYLSEETLMVQRSADCFIINETNNKISDMIFQNIDPYSDHTNLFPAKFNDKWGFIDEFGNVKIGFQYERVNSFNDSFCLVSNDSNSPDSYGLIDKNGKLILPFEYSNLFGWILGENRFLVEKDFQSLIVDKDNNVITKPIFTDIFPFGYANCEYYPAKMINGKWGFINKDGEPLKINKKSLNIPETKIDYDSLNILEQVKMIFT